ncbi:MAG: YciI family protein [Gammaproteobacteria bacterium]
MKYLCLICAERVMEQMPEPDAERHYAEYTEFTDDLRASGRLVGSNRLLPAGTAKTVRVRNGKASISDGPFAETKEQLGGYYLIEAGDMDEAVRIAAKIPGARIGCVEVRPVAEDAETLRALGFDAPGARP